MSETSGPARYEYEHDPAAIYRQSFSIVRAEADLGGLSAALQPVAVRLIHACGMTDIVADLSYSGEAVSKGHDALQTGAPVFTDVEMVAHGIIRSRLPRQNDVICTLNDPSVPGLAQKLGTTRSAAALDLWKDRLEGSVVAIGNAPTALFHLLEGIASGWPKPAVVLGFPVGFVGAAESKEALTANALGLEFIALNGRRGGSAIAAAAVNAIAAGLPEETASGAPSHG